MNYDSNGGGEGGGGRGSGLSGGCWMAFRLVAGWTLLEGSHTRTLVTIALGVAVVFVYCDWGSEKSDRERFGMLW